MCSWERHFREGKSRENPGRMPTFSSTLLDEIYRSIDEKPATRQGGAKPKSKPQGFQDDEEIASLMMACNCFVDKWMEKQVINENVGLFSKRSSRPFLLPAESIQQNDFLFLSSSSTSSDTSSGTLSSSFDTDFFGGWSSVKSTRSKPLPITSISPRKSSLFHQHKNEYDEYQNRQANRVDGENLIKSKSRALKIYANLKKVKQPISPGGRLTNFINSLFTNANGKKAKNPGSNREFEDSSSRMERKSKSTQGSSASSFSRSCLSKYSPKSRENSRNGIKRSVRFHPVSVIVDDDCRPCGHKSLYDEDFDKFERPQLPLELIRSLREKNKKTQEAGRDFSTFKNLCDSKGNVEVEEDEDDAASDSSSDLFELDHLALLGNNRFCEELPVYETTHLHTNRAIASGFIS